MSFEYDELNRLKRKKHGTTVVASYSYDGTQANNAIGRLITERDGDFDSGADQTNYTYDVMGRQLTANRTISGSTYVMSYVYDLIGNVTRISYPSASGARRLVEYSFSLSGEPRKVSDITGTPFDYVTNTTYSPLGTPSQVDLVNSVRTTLAWNRRGLVTSILTQKVGGATYLTLGYSYYNNEQIWQITDNLDGNKSEKYTYDELYRLLTAQRGPDASIQRKYSYDYDRYGNRWAQNLVAGSGFPGTNSFDYASNRVTSPSFSFDGSGNITANGPGASYTYNQESFVTAAGSVTYTRDAQGRRVRKTVGSATTDYFYAGSEVIAEKQGSTWTDYIFFGDQRIAKQTGATASTAIYLHADHLGSTRRCTDSNGNSTGTCDYEPFGENQPGSTCSDLPTNFRFAGMEWDSDAGLYHTWFRQYDPDQGRWMSVDPVSGGAANPQSLDRYAHVLNDPVNLTDVLGRVAQQIQPFLQPDVGRYTCILDGVETPCALVLGLMDEFDLLLAAFTWTKRIWERNCDDPGADCGAGWRYIYGNRGLIGLILVGSQDPQTPQNVRCSGPALITKGNPSHIGRVGAFRGRRIRRNSAVVAPEQFGYKTGEDMRSFSERIYGFVQYNQPGTGRVRTFAFHGIRDVISDRSRPNFRADRLAEAAKQGGRFLVELPGLPVRNFNAEGNVVVFVPAGTPCPQGTEPR